MAAAVYDAGRNSYPPEHFEELTLSLAMASTPPESPRDPQT